MSKRGSEQISRGVWGPLYGIKRSGYRGRGLDPQMTWWMVLSLRALASGICIHNKGMKIIHR